MQNYSYPSSSQVTITGIGDPTGLPVPQNAVYVAADNPSGDLQGLKVDTAGALLVNLQAQPSTPLAEDLVKVGGVAITLGQKASAASLPVVIASDQSDVNVGHITGPVALPTGASTETTLSAVSGKLPATLGQKAMAASLAVAIASDQSTLPVSAASLPLPSGAATSALQTTGNTSLSSIDGKLATLGQKTMAGSEPVVIASDQSAIPVSAASLPLPSGAATESTLSTMSGKLPATLGQKTSANSMAVVLASDQSSIPVSAKAATPTAGTVTQAAVSVGTTAVRATVSGSAPSSTRSVLVVTPDPASTATFYIGSSSVTNSGATRGIALVAGQSFTANSDAGDYYIISSTTAQTVFVMEQA